MFKKTYFITLMVAGLIALFFITSANAVEGSPKDIKFHKCADKAFNGYRLKILRNPKIFEADMCKFLNAKVGPECEDTMRINAELGFLQKEVSRFFLEKVIEPVCGFHPY